MGFWIPQLKANINHITEKVNRPDLSVRVILVKASDDWKSSAGIAFSRGPPEPRRIEPNKTGQSRYIAAAFSWISKNQGESDFFE